jgi:hypothetical protein
MILAPQIKNHYLDILQIRLHQFIACLLSTGFRSQSTATIYFTSIAINVNVGIPRLMPTLGAYRSLAEKDKQALSHAFASPPQKKQAVCPKVGISHQVMSFTPFHGNRTKSGSCCNERRAYNILVVIK